MTAPASSTRPAAATRAGPRPGRGPTSARPDATVRTLERYSVTAQCSGSFIQKQNKNKHFYLKSSHWFTSFYCHKIKILKSN